MSLVREAAKGRRTVVAVWPHVYIFAPKGSSAWSEIFCLNICEMNIKVTSETDIFYSGKSPLM